MFLTTIKWFIVAIHTYFWDDTNVEVKLLIWLCKVCVSFFNFWLLFVNWFTASIWDLSNSSLALRDFLARSTSWVRPSYCSLLGWKKYKRYRFITQQNIVLKTKNTTHRSEEINLRCSFSVVRNFFIRMFDCSCCLLNFSPSSRSSLIISSLSSSNSDDSKVFAFYI